MTDQLRQAAMQQALEALSAELWKMLDKPVDEQYRVRYAYLLRVITALREALAQPVQEPTQWRDMVVVTLVREGVNKHKARELADHFAAQPVQEPVGEVVEVNNDGFKCEFNQRLAVGAKLYTFPPAAQQAEPLEYWNAVEGWVKIDEVRKHFDAVNCGTIYKDGGEGRVPLYTVPAQREWVGLTDEEIAVIGDKVANEELVGLVSNFRVRLARAIEAKLKEKNNV